MNAEGYPKIAKNIQSLEDLADNAKTNVPIEAIDIINFSLGEDTHSRYNHFYTGLSGSLYNMYTNVSLLLKTSKGNEREFPFSHTASIKRHGFRDQHNNINSLTEFNGTQDGKPDTSLLKQYNELMLDYYKDAVFYESGTLEIVGNSKVKLGKTFTFGDNVPYNGGKIFYIEGYEDRYIKVENGADEWTQNIQLTRGAHKAIYIDVKIGGKALFKPSERIKPFIQTGDYTEDT